jgi:outer membrane protein assembly factor BamB
MLSRHLLTVAVVAIAQTGSPSLRPLRTPPVEKLTVNPGFRDWGPTSLAGTTIVGGNQTNRGGVFAIDADSGKVRWTFRPTFTGGTAAVSTAPAISAEVVITPFASGYPGAVVGVALATGKEIWRGPDPVLNGGVAVAGGIAFVLGKDGRFYALDATNGRERWTATLATRGECGSQPIVRDGTVYLTGAGAATPNDPSRPAGLYLFALDAATGQERWRYRAEAPYVRAGVCLRQPVVTEEAIYAAGDTRLYAVSRTTGRDLWKPIEVRRVEDGRERAVEVHGLVEADTTVIGMTPGFLIAFDKASGRTAWEVPGQYTTSSPSTAVAGNILYFQGSPASQPAAAARGTLHALDLTTREILWSFSRPTAEANWPFGAVTPFDSGLWVGSYQALVKLQ